MADNNQKVIIEEVAAAGGAPGSIQQKVADYYNAFLNQDAIDARGLAPIQPEIDEANALRTHEDVVRFAARPGVAVSFPLAMGITLDQRNPDRYIVTLTHGGLGLPEREYYRRSDGQFPQIREQYVAHIERMLGLAGQTDGAAKARAIMALETQIAERHWPVADRRQRDRTYNMKSRAEIRALAPNFPWDAGFEGGGVGAVQEVVVRELSAMTPLAELTVATPVETWRTYLVWHLVRNNAFVLPRTIDDANFAFYGTTLNGQPQQRERWKRAVEGVNGALGEAVGQIYVTRHFPPEAKAQMLTWSRTCAARTASASIGFRGCRPKLKWSRARSSRRSVRRLAIRIGGKITPRWKCRPATRTATTSAPRSGNRTTTSRA